MSKSQTLRALMFERLTAAAEEIFVLFERTIAEYEAELRRCKEENLRQLLHRDLRVQLHRAEVHTLPKSSATDLGLDTTETKEEHQEQSVKLEEEHQPDPVPEIVLCVKNEETQATDICLEQAADTDGRSEGESSHNDDDEDWKLPPSYSDQSAPETSSSDHLKTGDVLHAQPTVHREETAHSCSICNKTFSSRSYAQIHFRTHTDERPYSCSICKKTFALKSTLRLHKIMHTDGKRFKCTLCDRAFSQKGNLQRHERIHSGEKPYSCHICGKTFSDSSNNKVHMRSHSKQKKHRCTLCFRFFSQKESHICRGRSGT